MTALGDWLRRHQLEQLHETLAANDIDLDILPELSDADLEKLGLSLGNRRRLLKAIAAGETDTVPAAAAMPSPPREVPAVAAERRQVTVLFCDLAGSTALAAALDPEILGGLIRRYQDAAAGVIGRFGGFVAKFMGDGVLAYFGFPQAYEDAAERAVRAAIGLLGETSRVRLPDGGQLQARIGIATGLVVIGELIGEGTAQERTIVGETPNLAARLQGVAAPDTILIGEATQHLLGGLFRLAPSGPHDLKGIASPVTAWRVMGEAPVESRFAAGRHQADLPLIGRDHEIGLLLDRWRLARQGEGQIVTVMGEAGIGKSRLVEALQERLAGEPHARLHLQCSPHHTDSALYPMIQSLARAARFAPEDSAEARLAKLGALFPAGDMPLVAALMSLPATPSPLAPAQRKAATIALLVAAVTRLAGDAQPVFLLLEDAHWLDATTLELTTRLADSIASTRLLAVVTARPDFVPPWQARPHATLLSLGRLGRADCARLVAGVAAVHGLSAETMAAIVAKTDGVPLFAEELTKSMMESVGQDGAAVPATLKDSLMARLDRLGEAREMAQLAAVIGRQFGFRLLDIVAPKHGAALEAALAALADAGIVFPEGRGTERSFSFKHALMRDTAYESLLLSRRRDWHARIARALEAEFPETVASEPELLAYHFGEAGLAAEACDYRMRAGDQAVGRSAYQEAIAHFSAGLKLAESLPEATDRQRRQLDFLLKLGPAFTIRFGAQSEQVEATYRRAAEIGDALGDEPATYKAKWGLWLNANLARKTAVARDQVNEMLALAQRSGDGDLLLEAYHCGWSTAFFRGDLAMTLRYGRIGIETYDMARHRHLGPTFGGHDPGVCAHACSAMVLRISDDREQAAASAAQAVALGEALAHPFSLAHAVYNVAAMYQFGGDRERTAEMAERVIALDDKYGFPPYRLGASLLLAWTQTGRARDVALAESEIAQAAAAGPNVQYLLGIAGEVLLAGGRHAAALALLDRALEANEERDVGYYLAEIYRLRGLCLLALDRASKGEAQAAFKTALATANSQGATLFARRAEAALADLS